MPMDRAEFAATLRELRARHNLNSRQAAERIGIGTRQYSRWENAQADPYARNIEKVAAAYGLSSQDVTGVGTDLPQLATVQELARIEAKLDAILDHLEISAETIPPPSSKLIGSNG